MPSEEMRHFWGQTRAELDAIPMEAATELWEPLCDRGINAERVTLTSFDGVRLRGWHFTPTDPAPAHGWPALLTVPSYTGRVALPQHMARYGYAVLALYPRGQGESEHEWALPQSSKLTYQLTDRSRYYYRGAYMDCVRGIDFLISRPEVDEARVGMYGLSQGGGLTLATAALDYRVRAAVAWIPFLCNFSVAAGLTSEPYAELNAYLAEHPGERAAAMETLAWFDALHLADGIEAPVLVGIGGRDTVCPEETIMPVFQRIRSRKTLTYLPDLEHGHNVDYFVETKSWMDRFLR
ncbi:MAG: acetylxylan esterase [Chloroflexi bacterium]|nr:acetylxylan esterase [Chloroflexota bacterium]